MAETQQHLDTLRDIRNLMQRSSRFISLSGLSGIAAGCWALGGAIMAHHRIGDYYAGIPEGGYSHAAFLHLKQNLLLLAGAVLGAALVSAFYFTWRRAGRNNTPLWDRAARMLTVNTLIPLVAGGLFILTMLQYNEWRFVGPGLLLFYGLALVNGSKYTLSEIRYLGLMEIVLGLVNTQFPGYSLYFWAAGFGLLHILYGFTMWWRYERPSWTGAVAI